MKDAFFFKHDYNARHDPKMALLIRSHGYEAYGLAWAIVEKIYEQGGRLPHDPESIAYDLRAEQAKVEAVLGSPVFFIRDGLVGSERVDRDLDARRAMTQAGRESIARRKRADGSPWRRNDRDLVGGYKGPSTTLIPGEERRGDNDRAFGGRDQSKDAFNGLIEDLALSRTYSDGSDPLYRQCAIRGAHCGRRFVDIPADEAAFMLTNTPRLSKGQRDGLQARVDLKKFESRPEGPR